MRIILIWISQKCGEKLDWIHLDPWQADVNRATNALSSKKNGYFLGRLFIVSF